MRRRCRLQAPDWHHAGIQENQDTKRHIRVCTGREPPGWDVDWGKREATWARWVQRASTVPQNPACPSMPLAPTNTRLPTQVLAVGAVSSGHAGQRGGRGSQNQSASPQWAWDTSMAGLWTWHSVLQSSINDLHPPAPRVAQDLFHHLEKSIYCQ